MSQRRLVIVLSVLAAALASATCDRESERTAAPQARAPDAAPAQELPQPAAPVDSAPQTAAPSRDTLPVRPAGREQSPPRGAPPRPEPRPSAPPSPAVSEQQPRAQDSAAAVLQRASAAYADLRSLKADFVMHYNNPLLRQQTTSRGTLYQRQPDRIALRFTDPAGDVILSDGEFYWIYYPSIDVQQVIRCPVTQGSEQGVDLQAQFVGDPVRRFQHTLHGQESVAGRPAHVLTLEPRERAEYRTLKVWLDTRDALARRFEITEHNGTIRRFELSNFERNAGIPDATFRFTPPDNARTVSCG